MAICANISNKMISRIFALVRVRIQKALELAIAGASICDIFYILTNISCVTS